MDAVSGKPVEMMPCPVCRTEQAMKDGPCVACETPLTVWMPIFKVAAPPHGWAFKAPPLTEPWAHKAGTLDPSEGREHGVPTLREKARWAAAACALYGRATGPGPDEMETQIKDLLADLRHLCDREGYDYDHLDEGARGFYEAEINGELG